MVIFKKIRYRNFLSSGNMFTEIDLTKNKKTIVIGQNGSGKSTFLDALTFCLFNKAFRNINKPQLINSITGKGLMTETEFSIGNKEYLVRRGIKPNIFEVFVDGKLVNQSADNRDYQQLLEKNILKMNYKTFVQIVILGSANFTPFMQLTAADRRGIIEDLLDIQVFSIMNNSLKDKVNANKEDLVNIDNEIKIISSKIELTDKHIKELKQNNQKFIDDKLKKIEKCSNNVEELLSKNKALQHKIDELQETVKKKEKLETNLKKLNDLKDKLTKKTTVFEKIIDFYHNNSNCPTCQQSIDNLFKKSIIEKNLNQKEKVANDINLLNTEYTNISVSMKETLDAISEVSKLNSHVTQNNQEIRLNEGDITHYRKDISELEKKNGSLSKENSDAKLFRKQKQQAELQKEELINNRELLAIASVLLKDGGIKTAIIKQYIPIINKHINTYLGIMDFFVDFQIDENFNEHILSRHKDEFSYANFSEGEKTRIDLALLFTWRAISKMRNSASCNLIIFDEILDSSLDVNGTEEFLRIIDSLTKDNNVFIISHKVDQMVDRFDHVIRFEKTKNFSRIAN